MGQEWAWGDIIEGESGWRMWASGCRVGSENYLIQVPLARLCATSDRQPCGVFFKPTKVLSFKPTMPFYNKMSKDLINAERSFCINVKTIRTSNFLLLSPPVMFLKPMRERSTSCLREFHIPSTCLYFYSFHKY